ncbi:MAG: phospholipase D family protein [Candidatus Cloacimonetes bacterium]|nr:phospholipase D family protein [Candidatus Cloacimonadota bacterium]
MGMYFNGANCDIYIGKGAGKKLLDDIENAKKSVKVVSPYLSPFLIKELIKLRKRNLEVELITTDNIEDFYGSYEKNILKLIIQNVETDEVAVEKREKWKDISKILAIVVVGLLGLTYFVGDFKLGFSLIPMVILFLVYFRLKIKNKRIYNYWYSQLFPFKVYMSPDTNELSDTFIHGKIYLIDNQIAYLGSLNFTESGTKHNYETRIRTVDKNAIIEINKEMNQLFNHSHLPEKDIQMWGKQLYSEPIN